MSKTEQKQFGYQARYNDKEQGGFEKALADCLLVFARTVQKYGEPSQFVVIHRPDLNHPLAHVILTDPNRKASAIAWKGWFSTMDEVPVEEDDDPGIYEGQLLLLVRKEP